MEDTKLPQSHLMLGVGDGGGKLFVSGDYESIKECQRKLLDLEQTRRERDAAIKYFNEAYGKGAQAGISALREAAATFVEAMHGEAAFLYGSPVTDAYRNAAELCEKLAKRLDKLAEGR